MSQSITIKSVNYDGEIANIIFKPADEETAINLGEQVLPFIFQRAQYPCPPTCPPI